MFSRQARARRRLTALSATIADDRRRLAELEEQVAFLQAVESDAATDAVVRGPGAAREHTTASRDLARAVRERDEVREALRRHRRQQDELLEALAGGFDEPGGSPVD